VKGQQLTHPLKIYEFYAEKGIIGTGYGSNLSSGSAGRAKAGGDLFTAV